MKSVYAASVLALTASAAAAPSSRARLAERQSDTTCIVNTVSNPDSTAIINSINQWFNDVTTVNNFLNTAHTLVGSPDDLLAATKQVRLSAQDEPCQLQTLLNNSDLQGGTGLSDAFSCASTDLGNVFGPHVLNNLDTIIGNPSDSTSVLNAISDINTFRCCNVLPDVDLLWVDTADDFGVSNVVPITAPREDACGSIDCSTVSTAATCKSLGQ